MNVDIHASWKPYLQDEFNKSYFEELAAFVKEEYKTKQIYPPPSKIFEAFNRCPFENVRVVLLGQDPYHGPNQAHGLCFSVNEGIRQPPSLQNIFKELKKDLNKDIPSSGNLDHWADQGVLLLNATLTVQAGNAGSHQNKGWEIFTDQVIHILSEQKNHVVFLLWGAYAQKKESLIDASKHYILKAAHPSPFSVERGFFGCKHFSKTNEYLANHGFLPIEW